ncbi:MAG: lipoprotein [bacterium]|nr:lipoprotein [bacterium]
MARSLEVETSRTCAVWRRILVTALLVLFLAACSKGGGGDKKEDDVPPYGPVGELTDLDPAANEALETASVGASAGVHADAVDPTAEDVVIYALPVAGRHPRHRRNRPAPLRRST